MNWFTQFSCSNRETSVNRSNDTYTVNAYTLVGNHPLHIIAKCEQMKLMEHDYCTRLGTEKFRRFGLVLFSIFAVIYALFVILYTITMLESKHPFYYYNLFNQSSNGTLQWDYGLDTSTCKKVAIYLIESKNTDSYKTSMYQSVVPILYLLLIIFVSKNVCVILFSFPRIFRKMTLYFETLALILCFMNIFDWYPWQKPLDLRCPIQWQLVSRIYIEMRIKNDDLGFSWFALFVDFYSNLYAIYYMDELGSLCRHDTSYFFQISSMYSCSSHTHLWLRFYLLHVTSISNTICNSIRSTYENGDQSV